MGGFLGRYRLILTGCILLPALLCQSLLPLVPLKIWEDLSETLYPLMTRLHGAVSPSSNVVIVEIDHETESRFGWPIDRGLYVQALENLKSLGHPYVLSFLQFQAGQKTELEREKNQKLAQTMASYQRFIGSGVVLLSGDREQISVEQEEKVLPRALVAAGKEAPEDRPEMLVAFDESELFINAQEAFGLAPRYGTQSVIYCTRLSFTPEGGSEANVTLPTSSLWATSLFLKKDFLTSSGHRSYLEGARGGFHVGEKNCLSQPQLGTKDFLQKRGIPIIPLHKLIDNKVSQSLKGKLVILAHARMRKFQGPGAKASTPGSGVVPEHYLNARFIDDLMTANAVRRDGILERPIDAGLPLLIGVALLILSLLVSINGFILLVAAGVVGLLLASFYNLNFMKTYFIPLPLYATLILTFLMLVAYRVYLVYYGMRRVVLFRESMRRQLVQFQSFPTFVQGLQTFLNSEFSRCQLSLHSNFDRLYEASSSADKVAEYMASNPSVAQGQRQVQGESLNVAFASSGAILGGRSNAAVSMEVMADDLCMGSVDLKIQFPSWQQSLMIPLIYQFRAELQEQWGRVHQTIQAKVSDYEALIRNTRSQILEKFLSQAIVDKFQDGRTMEENLSAVLTPTQSFAAVMQADIRGYSGLFKDRDPITIVNMLKGYYGTTVDVAQTVAQVKLIGDCIFLFIEETGREDYSAADLAAFLSGILIDETQKENERQRGQHDPVVFGIAIHFGDVIMGNLSSANCIDYTVVGPNVNRTARMEELTKKPEIRELVGANGVLISKEAQAAFKHVQKIVQPQHLDLGKMGLHIRSFESIRELSYLTADQALKLCAHPLIHRKAG